MNDAENRLVEDRLRSAVRAYVPDHSAPPLRLPARRTRQAARPRRVKRLGWGGAGPGWWWRRARGWVVPVAAAAAVVAVVAAVVVITRGAGRGPADHPAARPQSVPPYYVASRAGGGPDRHGYVQVRATRTGDLVASVQLPRRYAYAVGLLAASGDDRAFLLFLEPGSKGHGRFFLLRLTPGRTGGTTRLIPLAIPAAPWAAAYALSPSGTMLAALSKPAHGPGALTIYNLITATTRTWTGWPPPAQSALSELAWSADGRWLWFCWGAWPPSPRISAGRLDPSAPGTRLPAPTGSVDAPAQAAQPRLLADGNLQIQVTRTRASVIEILSPQGTPPVVIPLPGPRGQYPAWSSTTGQTTILIRGLGLAFTRIGVLGGGGRYRPLPLAPALRDGHNTALLW